METEKNNHWTGKSREHLLIDLSNSKYSLFDIRCIASEIFKAEMFDKKIEEDSVYIFAANKRLSLCMNNLGEYPALILVPQTFTYRLDAQKKEIEYTIDNDAHRGFNKLIKTCGLIFGTKKSLKSGKHLLLYWPMKFK